MQKIYLLPPGPTPIPPNILLKMAEPIIHHRSPQYEEVFQEVRENLLYLFQTKNEVLVLASSGTGAMEGSVASIFSRGDRVLVVNGGKFGQRWEQICSTYGLEVSSLDVTWGEAVDPSLIEKHLKNDGSIRGVFTQATETSTGVVHPIKEIAEIVKNYEQTLMVVDATTGIGVFDVPMDQWNLDVVVTGSQKALMLPPGLAMASVSDKAWQFAKNSDLPKYYFNFSKELASAKKNQNSYTPAVSLIIGLREALRMIKEEGLNNLFARHERLASAARAGVLALGLPLFAKSPSNALTAVKLPQEIDGKKLVKLLRDKYGITIAGGQDHLKGKIIRIAHLGYITDFDLIIALSGLGMALGDMGHSVNLGEGVKAATEVLNGQ